MITISLVKIYKTQRDAKKYFKANKKDIPQSALFVRISPTETF